MDVSRSRDILHPDEFISRALQSQSRKPTRGAPVYTYTLTRWKGEAKNAKAQHYFKHSGIWLSSGYVRKIVGTVESVAKERTATCAILPRQTACVCVNTRCIYARGSVRHSAPRLRTLVSARHHCASWRWASRYSKPTHRRGDHSFSLSPRYWTMIVKDVHRLIVLLCICLKFSEYIFNYTNNIFCKFEEGCPHGSRVIDMLISTV